MIHAPDMRGEGIGAADHGSLHIINSALATSRKLKSTRDFSEHNGKAAQAYIDYINGAADWNCLWNAFDRKDTKWVQNDQSNTFYRVRMTLEAGSTWEVSGPSLISSLTVEKGAPLKGRVRVNGTEVKPQAGEMYTGRIEVTAL